MFDLNKLSNIHLNLSQSIKLYSQCLAIYFISLTTLIQLLPFTCIDCKDHSVMSQELLDISRHVLYIPVQVTHILVSSGVPSYIICTVSGTYPCIACILWYNPLCSLVITLHIHLLYLGMPGILWYICLIYFYDLVLPCTLSCTLYFLYTLV